MTFKDLGLMPQILSALKAQGYEKPTPIQRGAIPPALKGQDVLGCAQTGTGKTCAFAAPILQRLTGTYKKGEHKIRALILTPTRELALQIEECFEAYGKHLPLRSAVIFGGVGQQPQVEKIRKGLDILVATPGRLLDLHGQGLIDLLDVEIFVLDEADRMLDMGFIHDVRRVLKLLPVKKQTLFFSATMPFEVMELVNGLLHDYARVEVDPVSSPVEVIAQSLYFVDKGNKTKLLAHLIQEKGMDSVLVFSRTKHGANRIATDLEKRGITAAAIHGNKSQTALADFKAGRLTALIATDIAARGIDIDELKWVVNYDLPEVPETYIHRIGRTGRAGRDGTALSFCRADEKNYLKQIEKLLGRKLSVVEDHPYPMVEVATGVDPMLQAKREGKENARARAAERRQAQSAKAEKTAQAPKTEEQPKEQPKKAQPPKKKETAKKKEQPKKAEQPKPVQPPKAAPKPQEKPAPKPQVKQQGKQDVKPSAEAPKRGVRQQKLQETLPAAPAQASGIFTRPNPFEGDRIMDATARLLAPRPRMYSSEPPRKAQPEKKQPAKAAPKAAPPQETPSAASKKKKKKKPAPQPVKPQQTAPQKEQIAQPKPVQPAKQTAQSKGKNQSGNAGKSVVTKKKPPERRSAPNRAQVSHSRVKDSTEQASLMKPYYLYDEND